MFYKVIQVKYGMPVITGTVMEVCGAAALNEARQAAAIPGHVVVARSATVQEYVDYSYGKQILAIN